MVANGRVDPRPALLGAGDRRQRSPAAGAHNRAMDPFDLERFVAAQNGIYGGVVRELRGAHKTGHWMWFVFPQVAGLGMSAVSQMYAIRSLDEARAYLAHPILGPRLRECAQGVLAAPPGSTAESIFGGIDSRKLRSSMTLFLRVAPDEPIWQQVLDRYFGGSPDALTDELLARG
jgi:uncharacterized protein (DUF1810 family)